MERAKEKEGWLDYKRENDTISKCNNEAFGEGGREQGTNKNELGGRNGRRVEFRGKDNSF